MPVLISHSFTNEQLNAARSSLALMTYWIGWCGHHHHHHHAHGHNLLFARLARDCVSVCRFCNATHKKTMENLKKWIKHRLKHSAVRCSFTANRLRHWRKWPFYYAILINAQNSYGERQYRVETHKYEEIKMVVQTHAAKRHICGCDMHTGRRQTPHSSANVYIL